MERFSFDLKSTLGLNDSKSTRRELYEYFEKIGVYYIWNNRFEGFSSIDINTKNIDNEKQLRKELRSVFIEKLAFKIWKILNRYVEIKFEAYNTKELCVFSNYNYFITSENDYNEMIKL